MEYGDLATDPPRTVWALPFGGCLEYPVRLRHVRAAYGGSESSGGSWLHLGFLDLEPVQYHRCLPRIQMVRIQNQGQLPARMGALRRDLQWWHCPWPNRAPCARTSDPA